MGTHLKDSHAKCAADVVRRLGLLRPETRMVVDYLRLASAALASNGTRELAHIARRAAATLVPGSWWST